MNIINNKYNKSYEGFSLLEMIISIFIFVVTITTAVSIFVNVASARKKSREIQKNMEDARTALDLMAKNMRMSTDVGPDGNGQEIYMYNTSQGKCIRYRINNKKLQTSQREPSDPDNPDCDVMPAYPVYVPIIESDISGSFEITQTSSTEPKIIGKATIILKIDDVADIQTSVSFRDYKDIIQ